MYCKKIKYIYIYVCVCIYIWKRIWMNKDKDFRA